MPKFLAPRALSNKLLEVLTEEGFEKTEDLSQVECVILRTYTPPSRALYGVEGLEYLGDIGQDFEVINHFYGSRLKRIPIIFLGNAARTAHVLNGGELTERVLGGRQVTDGVDSYQGGLSPERQIPMIHSIAYETEFWDGQYETVQAFFYKRFKQLGVCFLPESSPGFLQLFKTLLVDFKKEVF